MCPWTSSTAVKKALFCSVKLDMWHSELIEYGSLFSLDEGLILLWHINSGFVLTRGIILVVCCCVCHYFDVYFGLSYFVGIIYYTFCFFSLECEISHSFIYIFLYFMFLKMFKHIFFVLENIFLYIHPPHIYWP